MNGSRVLRRLGDANPAAVAAAFGSKPVNKPPERFARYAAEERAGTRACFVAFAADAAVGYVTVLWRSPYAPLAAAAIPEIQDLNVIPAFRRQGIAMQLIARAEMEIAERCASAGIGVGLHPGYNAAQRLYVRLGYVPDGNGLTYRGAFVREGMQVALDDDLVLHLVKQLR